MRKTTLLLCLSFALIFALSAAAAPASPGALSAAQIVDKNVAARGGLQAWRALQTLSLEGKLSAGGNQRTVLPVPGPNRNTLQAPRRSAEEAELPFLMELKRGRKVRLELQFGGRTALQVYDGTNGWKLRPYLNRTDVEPYTADEMKVAAAQSDLDGLLVDYAAKGSRVEMEGSEKVEDHDTYKLKVTQRNGHTVHVWVDAGTFLETKIEGSPRRLDGTEHPVEVYYRDYRNVSGLQIPFVLETKVLPVSRNALGFRDTPVPVEKIMITKAVMNPKLDDALFRRPDVSAVAARK